MTESVSEHNAMEPEVKKNNFAYMFQQQLIQAWRPVPTAATSLILYILLATFFITIGVVMFIYTSQMVKHEQRYDNQCSSSGSCTVSIQLAKDIKGPVYLYYGLRNFYQTHRRYLKYKSSAQLEKGQQFSSVEAARSVCSGKTTNAQMGWTTAVDGTLLDPNAVAFPCGYVAYSFFNDTYSNLLANGTGTPIAISTSSVAWPVDKTNTKNWNLSAQGINIENQNWLVWLRPAVKKDFYKLYGVINQDLVNGTYNITINNVYPVPFGQKWIQLSNSNVFGNNDITLSIAYLIAGGISIVLLVVFIIICVRERIEHNAKKMARAHEM